MKAYEIVSVNAPYTVEECRDWMSGGYEKFLSLMLAHPSALFLEPIARDVVDGVEYVRCTDGWDARLELMEKVKR